MASPEPSASLLPKRGGASLDSGSHGTILSQPQGTGEKGLDDTPAPSILEGQRGDFRLKAPETPQDKRPAPSCPQGLPRQTPGPGWSPAKRWRHRLGT